MTHNNTVNREPLIRRSAYWMTMLLIIALLAPVYAADFQAGVKAGLEAFERGDFVSAVRQFHLLAEQGLAEAQYNLGVAYIEGKGVPKNDVKAYAWLNVAAAQDYTSAVEARDIVAQRVTSEARDRAQRLAQEYWEAYVLPFRD